ncbi:hypothetical protein BHM03_00004081, partial [Ensete ventricosum]
RKKLSRNTSVHSTPRIEVLTRPHPPSAPRSTACSLCQKHSRRPLHRPTKLKPLPKPSSPGMAGRFSCSLSSNYGVGGRSTEKYYCIDMSNGVRDPHTGVIVAWAPQHSTGAQVIPTDPPTRERYLVGHVLSLIASTGSTASDP